MALRVFSWTVFPVTLTLAVAWGLARIARGGDPAEAVLLPLVTSFAFVALAERFVPHHGSWLHSRGDLHVDAGLTLISGVVTNGLGLVTLSYGAVMAASLAEGVGFALWPTGWPLLAQLLVALVVAELPKYALHRLQHEWPPLWRIHAVHHSAERLYWLNAGRFHPIDIGLDYLVGVGVLVVLGAGPAVVALFALVSAVHGVFQHANLPLRCGPLNWFFSMAELHRWHHSPEPELSNHNYGQNLILWDVVFGTRYLPSDAEPTDAIGIEDLPRFPKGLWANLLVPFRWARVVRESRAA